jgi:hypothetical protein
VPPSLSLVVLVFGFRRPRALYYVLEGLRRQGALALTQVWLDGHQEDPTIWPKVEACARLAERFPGATWVRNGARVGVAKLLIHALGKAVDAFDAVLVLEDDCFPAEDAVRVLRHELERFRDDDETFSVYGHLLGLPGEHERSIVTFQSWGWAATSSKIRLLLPEFRRLWMLPEADFLQEVRDALTPEIRRALDRVPGKSDTDALTRRFCWDATMAFLAAKAGMGSRATPHGVVHNFGMGMDSGHFTTPDARFLAPPFCIVAEADLRKRFALEPPPDLMTGLDAGRIYRFGAGSPDLRLLGFGWSPSEPWGTWSIGDAASLDLGPIQRPRPTLQVSFRTFVPPEGPLAIDVELDGAIVDRWQIEGTALTERREIELPAPLNAPGRLVFHHPGTRSPKELGVADDARRLGIGLIDLSLR